jgi:predicted ATPase
LSCAGQAYAELGQFDDACRRIEEAITTLEATEERSWEAEVNRVAGQIALMSPEPDAAKAEAHFEGSRLRVHSKQIMGAARGDEHGRLWRDQGKRQQAHNLLGTVYGWFTEGFDTLDLKEAKTCSTSWRDERSVAGAEA